MKHLFSRQKRPVLSFDYQIRRSSRVKRTRIVVKQDKIEVVSPPGVPEKALHEFVYSQQQWVAQALKEIETRQHRIEPLAPAEYKHGACIPYRGERFRLRLENTGNQAVTVDFNAAEGFLLQGAFARPERHHEQARNALLDWMLNQALVQSQASIHKHAPRFQLNPRSLRIKQMRSRWGSCGIHNDININWLLILAPPTVLEYVVVHEICHIRYRNHSADFWALVGQHLPDYKRERHWLKLHGQRLMQGL